MDESQSTRASLILRLRNVRDSEAWSQFVRIYSPLVYGYACRRGLQAADAADVTQEVLTTVARQMPGFSYDPRRGSFRNWLMTVTRSRLTDFARRHHREPQGTGDTGTYRRLSDQASDEETYWEQEYRASVFDWALEQARPQFQASTWQAFWRTSIEGHETASVARDLGMSLGAVYIARSRVSARLKELVAQVHEL